MKPRLSHQAIWRLGCRNYHARWFSPTVASTSCIAATLRCFPRHARLGKGGDRPVNVLADRLAVMAALECVSLVTWFDEDTPIARILECRPDVLVKGGDWPVEKIVGNREVTGWGGRVVSIPFIHQKSTTALLEKIRSL